MFKGVKCIPPGAHFVYFALKDEDYQQKLGFYIYVNQPASGDSWNSRAQREMCTVRKWDPEIDQFIPLPESDEVAYQEGVRNFDFDLILGAYILDYHSRWLQLSFCITKKIIDRL